MGLKLKDLNSIGFLSSVSVIVVASFAIFVSSNWANEQDYFSGLEAPINEKLVGDEKSFLILEDFSFKPFSENLPSEHQVYSYESYFKGVRPDIGVRIGRNTVHKWSHRLLQGSKSPVRYVRYEILQDYLDIVVTVDYEYFADRPGLNLVSPAWSPGEVFKDIDERKPYDKSKDSDEPFVFDLRFRLRFPLVGYQNPETSGSLNTVYMEFTKQAIQTYYLKDFETYLNLSEKRIAQIEKKSSLRADQSYGSNLSPDEKLAKANSEIKTLMNTLDRKGSLSSSQLQRLKQIQAFLNGEDNLQIIDESMRQVVRSIENFKSSCLLPIVPSASAVKSLLEEATRQKVFAHYLVMEVISYDNQAGGVLKVSGLNRVIEPNLPQVDIYFVGIDQSTESKSQYFGTEVSKLFIAARMR
tara:strand:+ start:657 stop:1892 length:1236 start_codon:yes stop_codon:yes gene_type:complete